MLKIIFTNPTFFPNELQQIIQVLEKKDCMLHLRKPEADMVEYKDLLQAIPKEYHDRLVLHDYFHLAEKYKIGGFHLSTNKRAVVNIDTLAHRHIGTLTVSTSCHSVEEILALDGQFDYAFLSPIFPSISKQGYEGNLDMEAVKTYLQTPHKTKVIALGGIKVSKIELITAWGFDGYAMLGNIWHLPKTHSQGEGI